MGWDCLVFHEIAVGCGAVAEDMPDNRGGEYDRQISGNDMADGTVAASGNLTRRDTIPHGDAAFAENAPGAPGFRHDKRGSSEHRRDLPKTVLRVPVKACSRVFTDGKLPRIRILLAESKRGGSGCLIN